MSVTIEKLRTDIKYFTALRDQFITQYHQTCGSISVLEQQLKLLVDEEELEKEKLGQAECGETDENNSQLNKIINDIIEKQNEENSTIEPV